MLTRFKSPPFSDALFGQLHRSGGMWRGAVDIDGVKARLAIPGQRSKPDAFALDLAHSIPVDYAEWRSTIEAALFDHYLPYAHADDHDGDDSDVGGTPEIEQPDQVWPYTDIDFVTVVDIAGELGVEIGYRVAWDMDHVVGARIRRGRLSEFNGSVIAP